MVEIDAAAALDAIWILLCGFMVLDMQAGFLCLEAGLARAKNASNIALKNASDICVATLSFWGVGFGLMFGASHAGLIGTSLFAPGAHTVALGVAPFLFFQMAFASTAVTIVSGAVAERATFPAYLVVSATISALIYPVVGHAAWGGALLEGQEGWLAAMGFLDFAGATVVHSVGGWAALAFCIALGPRRGRFGRRPRRFEPSSIATASLGVIFLWIGWAGFNAGSALAFGADVAPIVLRTMLGAAAGGVCALAVSLALFGVASAQLTLNGVIAGLVAGTAGVNLFTGSETILAGALGALVMVTASFVMRVARIDDVVDAVPVHLAPGVLGTLLVALLADTSALPAGSRLAQLGVQAMGAAYAGAWTLTATFAAIALVRRVARLRVRPREEVTGLDASEHGIGNAFLELLEEMKRHQRTGRFSSRVTVERSTEVGMLAYRYNKVLDRVEAEIEARMAAMRREREMRRLAEQSFVALKQAQEDNAHAARHDRLTGLGNRLLLDEIVEGGGDAFGDRVETASGSGAGLLVVALDLDRFKEINDRHGHDAGDAVLAAAAQRLKAALRPGRDFGFRIGGDEFVALFDRSAGAVATPDERGPDPRDPEDFCERLRAELVRPVRHGHVVLEPGASVGYAEARGEAGNGAGSAAEVTDLRGLLKRADIALYEAKGGGRGRVVAYSDNIGSTYTAHVEELAFFRQAIPRGEIVPFLQTQVDALTGEIAGCEVLARWRHPRHGILAPDTFLPLADELGLIAELDREILDRAIAAHARLAEAGVSLHSLSVNVSARRLASPDLLDELRGRADLPSGLTFEILETAHLDTLDADLTETVAALKALGIRIEVDDFGTGHASLASILSLEPDALKIDRMFVDGVERDPARAELMQALIGMAARFGAETIVEGVETAAQAKVLTRLGADRLQGYAFCRPMPLEELLAALDRGAGAARGA